MYLSNKGGFSRFFGKILSAVLFFVLPSVILLMVSCEEDPTQIGIELKNVLGQSQPVSVDTISVFSYAESMDSIRSDHFSYAVLGNFQDPVFGWTNASFIAQYRLSQPWTPGHGADVDSVKLYLVVDSYNGNETTGQTVNVYESYKTLNFDSIYYSNMNVKDSISEWPVGSATFHPEDTMIVVYLAPSFGRRIINDTAVLKNQDSFLSHFKGFYIDVNKSTESNTAGFVKINLIAPQSYMAIYYHNDLSSSLMFPFYINSYSSRVNLFEHNYEEAPPDTRIRYLDQDIEDSVLYVQGPAGVYSRLEIPGIKAFRDSGIVLNSVKLILPVDSIPPTAIRKPPNLSLMVKDNGKFYHIMDTQLPDYYDGNLNEKEGNYTIGLTKQLQSYLLGKSDLTTFYLMVNDPGINTERVILRSRLNSNPLKLKIIYTRE